jgi:hypothetical protein
MFDLLLFLGVGVVALAAYLVGYGIGYTAGRLAKNKEQ